MGDQRIGGMIVDGFEVFHLELVRDDTGVLIEVSRDVADDVLNELGVVVSLFRDELFVLALQKRPELAGAVLFGVANQLLKRKSFRAESVNRDMGALIVRAVPGDFLAAGAEARHRREDAFANRGLTVLARHRKAGFVAHQTRLLGDRS